MSPATLVEGASAIAGFASPDGAGLEATGEEPGPRNDPVRHHGPILIIEDDPDTRQVMQQILEAEGYAITTASNGRDGLARLAAMDRPCLILLDLMMPVMDGLEFLGHFRARDDASGVPVLVVSAYHELAAVAEGVAGFLEKPVQLSQLVHAVRDYCGPPP